jgi:preprotein translocase subunit SecB
MRKKVKFSVILSVALLSVASFIILISCTGLGDLIPDVVLDTIWDVLGYNKPANLNALALSDSQVLLTWEDKVTGEDGFVIEYSTDGNNFSELTTASKNSINYFHTNLDSDTFYFYKVYAFDDEGQSDYSNLAFCKTQTPPSSAPDAPTNLQAVALSDTQIGLEWDDNSSNEDGFRILISTDGVSFSTLETVTPNTTSYTSDELDPLTPYYYKVIAYNDFDDSEDSNVANATTQDTPATAPDAPTNLQAAAVSNMRIDLIWTDNSEDEEVFYIQISTDGKSFTDIAKVKPNVTTYESTSLKPETTYYYQVYAANSAGKSSTSNIAKATTKPTPGTAPKAPTNLQAGAVSDVQVKIAWTDNSLDEDGFNIEMAVDEGNTGIEPDSDQYRWIAKVKPNETSFLVSSLKPDITFWFRVNAFNFYGPSKYSNSASARTLPYTGEVPADPTNLVAKAYSDTQIAIAWYDNSDNEDGFNIEISTDGDNFKWWTKLRPNTKEYIVSGLKPSYKFYFRVNAYNKYGVSGYSNVASATTNSSPDSPPAAPTNLVARAASDTQIDIQWSDNSDNEDAFYVEVSEDGSKFGFYAKVPPDEPSFSMGGLKPNLTLYFRVLAVNSFGKSEYSNIADATTLPEPSGEPAAPTNLVAKAYSDTQIVIGWSDNSDNEDGFNIEISTDGVNFKWWDTVRPNIKEYLVEGLKPNVTFYFRVNAFNRQGKSSYSNIADATTLPTPSGAPADPTNLVAKAVSDTVIELSWTDNSDNEDAFNIEISKDGDNFEWWDKVNPDTTGYPIKGLRANTQYWFRVNAINAQGTSGYSNTATATTNPTPGTEPAAPTSLIASAKSDTLIALGWTDNSDNEEGFNVEISGDGIHFSFLDNVGSNIKEYAAGGLKPETTYYFRVNAFNSYGNSGYTNVAKATTLATPDTKPDAPESLTADPRSDTVIYIEWKDMSDNEDGFNIEISTDGTNFKWWAKVKTNTTAFGVEGLRPNTQHWFRVNAFNAQGTSGYSNTAQIQRRVLCLQRHRILRQRQGQTLLSC